VDLEVCRHLLVDPIEKASELDRPVPSVQLADHLTGGHVQSGEERGGAVQAVVVASPLRRSRSHGEDGLGAVESLDLSLLVGTEHQRPFRRVQVEADDVAHLLDQLGIVGELEGFGSMRLQAEGVPDPQHSGVAEAAGPGHLPRAPVSGVAGSGLQGLHHHRLNLVVSDSSRRTGPGFVEKTAQTSLDIARAPFADRLRGDSQLGRNAAVGKTIGTAQDNVSAASEPVARLGTLAPTKELGAVFFGDESEALGRPRCMA
jgi:hypothetical protein